jgi:hypothetical protein
MPQNAFTIDFVQPQTNRNNEKLCFRWESDDTRAENAIGPIVVLTIFAVSLCQAQGMSCDEVAAISNMAESESNQSLLNWQKKAGGSYIAHRVYSFRSFELQPTEPLAASRLLSMIPPPRSKSPFGTHWTGSSVKMNKRKTLKRLQHCIHGCPVISPERFCWFPINWGITSPMHMILSKILIATMRFKCDQSAERSTRRLLSPWTVSPPMTGCGL